MTSPSEQFSDDPLTEYEERMLLHQFGEAAGWDDPEMDVYDALDPRRVSPTSDARSGASS